MKYQNCEIVATVTKSFHCANMIKAGEVLVFDMQGRMLATKSTANLCLGIIAKLQPAILMAQDRMAEGLHPISPRYKAFDCFDTGIDHGGTGKVFVDLHLRDADTQDRVEP
ncbi:hypothetical protein [Puniceibacterium sp. IMCC21224]|uniref:hypothetical protein n=1 Tax=Puniceibacterium sp. IMCC21224 TaxID=1618204 RepID=UPI00064DF6F0|nr:hypothetical protein [Puniceibacterium sp. IMCC21224]KMK64912.1 hypothetical protein IMCC21224_12157 [Puniceibacterium sp. IMCC21224]